MMPGAPSPPRCTLDGEYEKKQCHGSTGHCWCVDKEGLEIGGTRREPGVYLDCNNVVPVFPDPITTPKPRVAPGKGAEDEILTSDEDLKNSIDNMPSDPDAGDFDIKNTDNLESNQVHHEQHQGNNDPETLRPHALLQPGLLAGIIGGAVVGLLCAVLLVMFIVYRMRKKDEGSYALDEPKRSPSLHTYARATNREFYA
jgi:syndecan 2